MVPVFTVAEVARLLKDDDGEQTLTPRAIRYYRRSGMVEPTGGRLRGRRGARLYTLVDVAVLRLAWLLRTKYRVSERGTWAVLVLQGGTIRRQVESGDGAVVFDDPAPLRSRGREDQRDERPSRVAVAVPIRIPITLLLPPKLVRVAQTFRVDEPDVWTGSAWIPATVAAREAIA